MLEVNFCKITACENCIDEFCIRKLGKFPVEVKYSEDITICFWCDHQGYSVISVTL